MSINHRITSKLLLDNLYGWFRDNEELFYEIILSKLKAYKGSNFILIATCHRFELYVSHLPSISFSAELLREIIQETIPNEVTELNVEVFTGKSLTKHLIRLCCGLDSFILGERDIFMQVKSAYKSCKERNFTDKELDLFFDVVITKSASLKRKYPLRGSFFSYADVAIEIISKNKINIIHDASFLIIGTGMLARKLIKRISRLFPLKIFVAGRSRTKVEQLAEMFDIVAVDLVDIKHIISEADIILTCIASNEKTIKREDLSSMRRNVLILDLGVPKNIEEGIGDSLSVAIYDMSDMDQEILKDNKRKSYSVGVLSEEIDKFLDKQ